MTTEVLLKKGKKGAAAYFRAECTTSPDNPTLLHDFLSTLLDPGKPIGDWDTIDWCRWLMAGGSTFDEYAQTVRRYDNATTCGLVWTVNFVAYRCRTCGISQCMSLCAECFQQGNHEGHDFNMFRSQAGGACDCGDTSVMKESGFCSRHGPKAQMNKAPAPPDLLCVAEAMMPRIILRLIQHLRDSSVNTHQDPCPPAIDEADLYLTFLHNLSEMGAAMRKVITQALTNPNTYHNLTKDCDSDDPKKIAYMQLSNERYEQAKKKLRNCECPAEYQDIPSLRPDLEHNTFLEELMLWTVKYQFPQKLVCFLLNMLPDLDYKEAFAKTFVHHYSRISVMLAQSNDTDTLSNRVVHVSVQLFSNEALVLPLTQHYKLLHVMVISLMATMKGILQGSTLQNSDKNFHQVVNCAHHIMRNHCYWPLVSDLNNILTHRPVALIFLQEPGMLDMWFEFISRFQGMNVNQREMSQHVEFESNTYYAAFSAELEASATPMWTLISHIKNSVGALTLVADTLELTKDVLTICKTALQDWFDAINFSPSDEPNPYQVTFHLPLHRYFAVFLGQAVKQGASLTELLPSKEMLQMLMVHPLQIQAVFQEILCGIWVRNGLQIKGQALTYIQCHFCNSMVDADLFILQLCATHLDPDAFIKTIMERFHVWEWFSFRSSRKNSFLQNDDVIPMLEGALNLIATIVGIRTNLGLSEEEVTRQEMVSLLCMTDRTHSQLMEMLPEKCGTTSHSQDFERILAQIADYRAPNFEAGGQMMQGMYIPKPEIWDAEYDPIHVLLRAVHRRDYQSSMDRYRQYVRQSGKFTKAPGSLWPPYRIPGGVHPQYKDPRKILHCKTMHGIIFTILYRAYYDQDIPDQILALCIYFLELAVNFRESPPNEQDIDFSEEVPDQNYAYWFPGDDVIQNMYINVKKVVSAEQSSEEEIVEEMDVDDYGNGDSSEEYAYQVHTPGTEERLEGEQQHHPLPAATVPLALPASSATEASGTVAVVHPVVRSQSIVPSRSRDAAYHARRMLRRMSAPMPALPSSTASTPPPAPPTPPPPPPPPPDSTLVDVDDDTSMAVVLANPESAASASHEDDLHHQNQAEALHIDVSSPSTSSREMLAARRSAPQIMSFQITKMLAPTCRITTEVNESMLSLLVKLHSKLSGVPDSYRPQKNRLEHANAEDASGRDSCRNRIGDGPYFIGNLLDTLVQVNGECGDLSIQDIRQKTWPKLSSKNTESSSSSGTATDVLDREERKRRARERQQKLMEEFRSRQKAFMQKTMVSEPEMVPQSPVQEEKVKSFLNRSQEYECVICGHNGPSTPERPMGLVILLQATSVLGHCQHGDISKFKLPCENDSLLVELQGQTLAAHMRSRLDRLTQHFDSDWHMAVNVGWEGGVHVQSCGHCLHVDCHKAYMLSLMNERQQNVIVEKEYYCPLCRQLANSVLPISPDIGKMASIVRSQPGDFSAVATELLELFSSQPSADTIIDEAAKIVMEDLTSTTYHQYSRLSNHPNNYAYIFLSSVARINLEIELIQRITGVFASISRRSCFVPLFHVLALHAKCSLMVPFVQLWSQLTGLACEENCSSLTPLEREVPLLLRDPSALLLNLVLSLPLNIDKVYYTSVVQVLYNLAFLQAVVKCTCLFSHRHRSFWKSRIYNLAPATGMQLDSLIGLVIDYLEHSCLYLQDDDMDPTLRDREWRLEELEQSIKESCLPFLKVAALLQHHLYEEEFPDIQKQDDWRTEFSLLCTFLGLLPQALQCSTPNFSTADCLKWATAEPPVLIRTLCQDFINFVSKSVIAARNLLEWPIAWHPPRLLELPTSYVQIFQHFHRRMCNTCRNTPKDPSVCLVCGMMVCMRENCCREKNLSEAVGHSITCGSGTAIFLAVNSCTIIVIRGKRACLWGSIYLDSFGEEDRDLKRGKPLYLSQDRYKLLQQQWLGHTFDHINKRWILHKGNL